MYASIYLIFLILYSTFSKELLLILQNLMQCFHVEDVLHTHHICIIAHRVSRIVSAILSKANNL